MGLIVLLYLFLFFIYIFCFTLFYFIYCKISNLYFILFLFSFCYFFKEICCRLTSHEGMYTQKGKKKKKRFWEGRDQLSCIHMEGKDSLKERERYSDFRKRKRKRRKKFRIFLFQRRGFLEARRYKKERGKKKDVGVHFGGKKDNNGSLGFLLRISEKNHSWKSSELS